MLSIDLASVASAGSRGAVVVRLLMAANDILMANRTMSLYVDHETDVRQRQAALKYLVRLQCGHLSEGLKIIGEIRLDSELHALLEKCKSWDRAAFHRLVAAQAAERKMLRDTVGNIRDKTGFHYDPDIVASALAEAGVRKHGRMNYFALATDPRKWRFGVADDVMDVAVVKGIWGIPLDRDAPARAIEKEGWANDLCKEFVMFAGGFGYAFMRQHAAR